MDEDTVRCLIYDMIIKNKRMKGIFILGMPVEFNTMIVTKGNEKRIEENIFLLEKEGYRVYPLDIPMDVRKTKTGEKSGTGEVQSSNGRTAGQALHTDSRRSIRQTEKQKPRA